MSQPKRRLDDEIGTGFGNPVVGLLFWTSVLVGIGVLFRALVFLFGGAAGTAIFGTTVFIFIGVGVSVLTIKAGRDHKKQEELLRQEQETHKQQWEDQQHEERRRQDQERRQQDQEREEQIENTNQHFDNVHLLNGTQFELFLAELFRRQGYEVQATPASGDQGADLLLYKDERRIAVQAKRWKKTVGNEAVRDVHAASSFYNTYEAWVVTTSFFSKPAIDAAWRMRVRLIDGEELAAWVRETQREDA